MKYPARAITLGLLTVALAGCAHPPTNTPPGAPQAAVAAPTPPTPTGVPTSPPQAPGAPSRAPQGLVIPKLAVTAPIAGHCATLPDGEIEPPADINATCTTGRDDPTPTGTGYTALTGHTTRAATTGALEHINQLAPGDTLTVDGAQWVVVQTGTYPATALPPGLFTPDGPRRLILTTCHLTPEVIAGAPYTETDTVVATPS